MGYISNIQRHVSALVGTIKSRAVLKRKIHDVPPIWEVGNALMTRLKTAVADSKDYRVSQLRPTPPPAITDRRLKPVAYIF